MRSRLNRHIARARTEQFGPVMELAADSNFINLAPAQHYHPPAPHIVAAVHEAADLGLFRYGRTAGEPELVEAIAARMKREHSLDVDPMREVRVTHGAGHAFLMTLMAFLEPGDEVLTIDPSFPLNWYTAELLGGRVIGVPMEPDLDSFPERLRDAVTSRTKALVMHPVNNPTGHVFGLELLEGVAQVAQHFGLLVLSDEVYSRFAYDEKRGMCLASLGGMWERTVTISGVSKDYNVPGLRVGWLVAPADLTEAIGRIQHNGPVGASVIGQRAAVAALTGPQDHMWRIVDEFSTTRRRVAALLEGTAGVRCPVPEGGFFVFPDVSALGIDVDEFYLRVAKEGRIGLAPGTWYGEGGNAHLRICYGAAPWDRVLEFLERLQPFLTTGP